MHDYYSTGFTNLALKQHCWNIPALGVIYARAHTIHTYNHNQIRVSSQISSKYHLIQRTDVISLTAMLTNMHSTVMEYNCGYS